MFWIFPVLQKANGRLEAGSTALNVRDCKCEGLGELTTVGFILKDCTSKKGPEVNDRVWGCWFSFSSSQNASRFCVVIPSRRDWMQSSIVISWILSWEDIHSCITKHTGSLHWLQLLTVSASIAHWFSYVWLGYAHTSLYTESYSACTTSVLLHERKCNIILCCPRVNINPSCNINDTALSLM